MKHGIGNAGPGAEVESLAVENFIAGVDQVTQHGKQQFPGAANHLAVDKRTTGRRVERNLQAMVLLDKPDFELFEGFVQGTRIVAIAV